MAQWGTTDDAANSVLWGVCNVQLRANTDNRDAFFGNTTANAYGSDLTVGQFGVDASEIAVTRTGNVATITITSPGSGYTANAAVTIGGVANGGGTGATANATSNTVGRIQYANLSAQGSSYESMPDVVIAAPANVAFSGNATSVDTSADWIALGANAAFFANGDLVTYFVAASNTIITSSPQVVNNTVYMVRLANSTGFGLATVAGANIDITSTAAGAQAGHFFRGATATAALTLNQVAGDLGYAHIGWNIRTILPNGRTRTECLVAMSKNGMSTDATDDTVLPDA